MSEQRAWTRREFVGGGLLFASASLAVPRFLQASALGLPRAGAERSSLAGVPEDRVLVVLQLSGGNDGLNTVVPYGMDDYYRARPGIGVRGGEALRLSGADGLGLHPALAGMHELYDEGLCSIVQGVGYPNPNRSHFKSMDIWHTAETSGVGDGWLGRYFDSECCGQGKGESGRPEGDGAAKPGGMPAVAIGREAPLAMQGRRVKPIAFENDQLFRWLGDDVHESLREPYRELAKREAQEGVEAGSNADFLLRTALDAQVSSEAIRRAVRQEPLVRFPRSGLGRQLTMVSNMIRAGLPTRVYYVTLGGFDTHAGQGAAQGRHARLLGEFAAAVRAFYQDLQAQGNDGRVLTMTFSEFGRRVGQNASRGTDHGTAAPMFLFGPMVRAGVFGEHPSLTDLDQGDLKYRIDFRSVYADVLKHWLETDSEAVLGGRFRATKLVRG